MQNPGWEETDSGPVKLLLFLGWGDGYSRVQCVVIIDPLHLCDKYPLHSNVQQKHSHVRYTKDPKKI